MLPYWAEITQIQTEAPGTATDWLRFLDTAVREGDTFHPGQFNQIYLPGYGESAISISSDIEERDQIGHTIRYTGNVTQNIARLKLGDVLGVRGPLGTSWPIEDAKGSDIVITAGWSRTASVAPGDLLCHAPPAGLWSRCGAVRGPHAAGHAVYA